MSAAESKIFARLKVQLSKYGYMLRQSGPVSYLAERWEIDLFLATLEDAEEFLTQVRRGNHGF